MELTSEKSCCSAGNNQVDEQAGITQHRLQLSRRWYLPLSDGTGCHDLSFPHVNIIVTVWKRTKQEFANVLFGKSCCIPQVLIFCISVFPSYTCLFSIIEESILNKTR